MSHSKSSSIPTRPESPATGLFQDSRDRVLGRIRSSLGRTGSSLRKVDTSPVIGPRPEIQGSLLDRFCEQSLRLSASVDLLESLGDVPAAARAYLQTLGLPLKAVCWPSLADLGWQEQGMQVEARPPSRSVESTDLVGITGCFAAVAETGTLALRSGPEAPASMALLPETHLAVVYEHQILGSMEEVFGRLRSEGSALEAMPRALNFISGPSRTADIEQTLVLGAHGPYRVHLLVIRTALGAL